MPDGTSPAAAEAGGGGKFGPLLEELRAFIPRALIGDSGWAGLLGRVGGLPEEGVASSCGFEFRLDDASPAADFFVVIRPGEPLAHYYIGRETADGADAAAAALARHLVRMDPDAGPSRGDSVAGWNDGMTLEYDVAEVEGNGRPAPGVFLRMRLTRSPERKDPHHCHPRTAVAGIAAAVGWEPDEEERRAVERAFGALPAGSEVAHIGGLPGRRPRAVRLLIQRIERTEVPDFLERVQWPGAAGGVVSVLNDFGNISGASGFRWTSLPAERRRVWGWRCSSGMTGTGKTTGSIRTSGSGGQWWSGWRPAAGVFRRKRVVCSRGPWAGNSMARGASITSIWVSITSSS